MRFLERDSQKGPELRLEEDEPRGFFGKSFPSRLAWKRELICASPGPEWLKTMKWILKVEIKEMSIIA
jgi:hypothetical protein